MMKIEWDDDWIKNHYDIMPLKDLWERYNDEHSTSIKYHTFASHTSSDIKLKQREQINWHDGWIVDNFYSYPTTTDCCIAYCEKFGISIERSVFSRRCVKLGFNRRLTESQKEFIRSNYSELGMNETIKQLNEKFGTRFKSIENFKKKEELHVTKERKKEACSNGSFEIGSTKKHHGYTYIKVSDDIGSKKNWKLLHHKIYEENFGEIPKGHIVIFLDNNPENFDIENLIAIPVEFQGLLNGNLLKSNEPILTKCAIKWCELYKAIEENNIKYNTSNSKLKEVV